MVSKAILRDRFTDWHEVYHLNQTSRFASVNKRTRNGEAASGFPRAKQSYYFRYTARYRKGITKTYFIQSNKASVGDITRMTVCCDSST